jgi:ATP-binding cassette subfamily F protein 3
MDMRSKDILKHALTAYDGTLLVVSHDREFLDGLVDKIYEFRDNCVKEHLGGINDFLRRRKLENLQQLEWKNVAAIEAKKAVAPASVAEDRQAKKEQERRLRKLKNELAQAEQAIATHEHKIAEMETVLANPVPQAVDETFFSTYQKEKHALERKMYEWELLMEQLTTLNA